MDLNLEIIISLVVVLLIFSLTLRNLRLRSRNKHYRANHSPELGDVDTIVTHEDFIDEIDDYILDEPITRSYAEEDPSDDENSDDDTVEIVEEIEYENDLSYQRPPVTDSSLEKPSYYSRETQHYDKNHVTQTYSEPESTGSMMARKRSRRALSSPQAPINVIHVLSKQHRQFSAYELMQALSNTHMIFGEMDIFHRHQEENGEGEVLFSLASATEPGTFDMQKMRNVICKGLILLMTVSGHEENIDDFELMLTTAMQLAEDLDGDICDDKRQPLTTAKIESCRSKIRDYSLSAVIT